MSKKSDLIKQLREMTVESLKAELLKVRKEQFTLRLKAVNGALDKPHQITTARKTIARIKTLITEKAGESC